VIGSPNSLAPLGEDLAAHFDIVFAACGVGG